MVMNVANDFSCYSLVDMVATVFFHTIATISLTPYRYEINGIKFILDIGCANDFSSYSFVDMVTTSYNLFDSL